VRCKKRLEVMCASDAAFGKRFLEGTVVAKTGSDVAPFLKKRLVGSASGDVSTDGHGAEGAAVIALAARDDAKFFCCAGFEMKLAREFDGGFGGFGAAGTEVDAAVCEIRRGQSKQARGQFFRRG